MKTVFFAAALSLAVVVPSIADPQSDYIAMSVSTMQAANDLCGFGLSDEAILAASVQLGGAPSDPAFVASVARQRAVFDANFAAVPPEMLPDLCNETRELLTQIGL